MELERRTSNPNHQKLTRASDISNSCIRLSRPQERICHAYLLWYLGRPQRQSGPPTSSRTLRQVMKSGARASLVHVQPPSLLSSSPRRLDPFSCSRKSTMAIAS